MTDDRFRAAARAYFVYGVVYWIGGVYLALHGVGVRGVGSVAWRGVAWILIGLVLVFLIPFLLGPQRERPTRQLRERLVILGAFELARRPRAWFYRWVLSRRDFARLLAVLMGVRAWQVAKVALRSDGASVPAPWDGKISFQAGAIVFFLLTVVALAFVVRAAWQSEPIAERDRR